MSKTLTKSFYYARDSESQDDVNRRADIWMGTMDGKIELLGNTDGPYGNSELMKELKFFYKEKAHVRSN